MSNASAIVGTDTLGTALQKALKYKATFMTTVWCNTQDHYIDVCREFGVDPNFDNDLHGIVTTKVPIAGMQAPANTINISYFSGLQAA